MEKYIIEYLESLKTDQCIIMKYTPDLNFNDHDIYIHFGIYCCHLKNKSNIFIVNLEQLSRCLVLTDIINLQKRYPLIHLLDYSNANCSILKKEGISSKYLPYQANDSEIYNYDKIYDYVICADKNNRKSSVYDSLTDFDKHVFIQNKWGNDRDTILMRSKVLINIHHLNDYNILEEIRITRCILNKVIVISENSQYQDMYPLSKYIIFGKYEDLTSICKDVLQNYDKYFNNIYNDFDLNSIKKILQSYQFYR